MEPITVVRMEFIGWLLSLTDEQLRVVLGLVEVVKSERGRPRSRAWRRVALPASN